MSQETLDAAPTGTGDAGIAGRVALVVAWCAADPGRVGEVLLPTPGAGRIFGRSLAEDARRRCPLVRQRPGENAPRPPIDDARVSRAQLALRVVDGGRLGVRNLGRCPLAVNGVREDEAEVGTGDLLQLADRLLFLVTTRPEELPAVSGPLHVFGEADADGIVGEGPIAWTLREQIRLVAPRERHVLLRGESGSGKELVARALHARSRRAAGPLVARNAATLPEALIDAELFGNARNYPNPGMPERSGLIGEADGGTLFLDEIGELPEAMQAHLLRVMDGGEYQRLGEARARRSDLRLVGATNRPESALKHDIAARFPLHLRIPALRDRREDIPLLLRHLLRRVASEEPAIARRFVDPEHGGVRVDPSFVAMLLRHPLDTNVRQLERFLWDAILGARGGTLRLTEDAVAVAAPQVDPATIRPEQIAEALRRHKGVQARAVEDLGLRDRYVLRRLMRRFEAEGWSFQ